MTGTVAITVDPQKNQLGFQLFLKVFLKHSAIPWQLSDKVNCQDDSQFPMLESAAMNHQALAAL